MERRAFVNEESQINYLVTGSWAFVIAAIAENISAVSIREDGTVEPSFERLVGLNEARRQLTISPHDLDLLIVGDFPKPNQSLKRGVHKEPTESFTASRVHYRTLKGTIEGLEVYFIHPVDQLLRSLIFLRNNGITRSYRESKFIRYETIVRALLLDENLSMENLADRFIELEQQQYAYYFEIDPHTFQRFGDGGQIQDFPHSALKQHLFGDKPIEEYPAMSQLLLHIKEQYPDHF